MKIDEMQLLIRVAETGSMPLAARQLHLTPSAVSAAVQRLEADAGIRIFERTTRSLRPTEEGLLLLEGLEDVVGRWHEALERARGQRAVLHGSVRISAPADTTYQLLEPLVVELCTAHPRLRVIVEPGDTIQHLQRGAIDIAIRYGALPDSSLTVRRLAHQPTVLVAAPSYLERNGSPLTPDDLADHACLTLQLGGMPTAEWDLHTPSGPTTVTVNASLCGDGYLARRWAVAGHGIAFKSLFDVVDDLDAGRLVHVLPHCRGASIPIHAVTAGRRYQPARIRALLDTLETRFANQSGRCDAWQTRKHANNPT